MKSALLALIVLCTTGCFSFSTHRPELLPKLEEKKGADELATGRYLFRIFGIDQPFLALYNPTSGALSHIYKVQASSKGGDFWPQVKQDMRVTRESRYFAVSSALNPQAFLRDPQTGEASGSFRADIYRGEPSKLSSIGRNILFSVGGVIFHSGRQPPPATTHIFVGSMGDYHGVPMESENDLLSFTFVDGLIKGQPGNSWLAIQFDSSGSVPGRSTMGCVSNYAGKILSGPTSEEAEISAICERQGRAGPG